MWQLDVSRFKSYKMCNFVNDTSNSPPMTNLTFRSDSRTICATMATKRQNNLSEFIRAHPVFTLEEIANAFGSDSTRTMMHRLRRHIEANRLMQLERGLYASVPPEQKETTFSPDPFVTARVSRPDAVFCYHSALELLGVAHSAWNQCAVFCTSRRPPLSLTSSQVVFLDHPGPLRKGGDVLLGTRKVERRGVLLRVTGPERTLVEGFRRPDLTGGVPELVNSAGGFPVLDLSLLERVLTRYSTRQLWGAVGWFLERYQETFHVPDEFLKRLEARRPHAAQYIPRRQRGGVLASRWNVILPPELMKGEPDER